MTINFDNVDEIVKCSSQKTKQRDFRKIHYWFKYFQLYHTWFRERSKTD